MTFTARFGIWNTFYLTVGITALLATVIHYGPKFIADPPMKTAPPETENQPQTPRDTTLNLNGHAVELRFPQAEPIGTLVLLPGWNYPRTGWCTETTVCEKALQQGFALVLPEMGQSIYAGQLYPESKAFYNNYPLRPWLYEAVIPALQRDYRLLLPGQRNFALGLSTGGRGAAFLGLEKPEIFTAVAALSGDFDQNLEPNEKLANQLYGPQSQFPERWSGPDNIRLRAAEFKTPIYLGHGLADPIVPVLQTQKFAEALKAAGNWGKSVLHLPANAQHDYTYWGSEVDSVLAFFGRY